MKARNLLLAGMLAAVLSAPGAAAAQCSVCRDATSGRAPQARKGLRRAIPVLGVPALMIFCGILAWAFHLDRRDKDEARMERPNGEEDRNP